MTIKPWIVDRDKWQKSYNTVSYESKIRVIKIILQVHIETQKDARNYIFNLLRI